MEISVVIPTLNEVDAVGNAIQRTRQLGVCEIVVVDGGSTDQTPHLATDADQVLFSPVGRATQQNAGATSSGGDVLLFLHADCWIESGSFEAIRSALARGCVGGCFRQRIESAGLRYRLVEWGNAWRVRCCKWAYGDQGIFVRRDVFERIGGFPDVCFMEDLFLMKRLKREGCFCLLDGPRIHISARRWQRSGVTLQTLRNSILVSLAQCGVPPDQLARFYPHVR